MTLSTMVPSKSTGEFIAKRIIAYLRECGSDQTRIIVKSDQEPAIVALQDEPVNDEFIPLRCQSYQGTQHGHSG